MNNRHFLFSLTGIAIAILCTVTPFFNSGLLAEEKQEVNIGVILPLTGNVATWGIDAKRLLPLFEEQFNKKSKKYHYKFLFEDGGCGKGNAAISASNKLLNLNHVKFLILGCSGEMLAVGPVAQRRKIVAMCFVCSHPDIKKIGDFIFRTYIDTEQGVTDIAKILKETYGNDIAILTEENAFTFGIRDVLIKALGGKVTFAEDYPEDTQDFKTLLLKANASHPKAYFLNNASPSGYITLFRQLKQFGIDAPLYAYHQPGNKVSIETLGKEQDGTYFFDVPDISDSSDDFMQLLQTFQTTYPDGAEVPFLLRTSYDAAYAIVSGIEQFGPDAEKVRDYISQEDLKGALGHVTFDSNGDIQNLRYALKKIVGDTPMTVQ